MIRWERRLSSNVEVPQEHERTDYNVTVNGHYQVVADKNNQAVRFTHDLPLSSSMAG